MNTTKTTVEKLQKFVSQRAGLDYANYGDLRSFRAEQREITKDLHDFRELLSLAFVRMDNLNERLTEYLEKSSGRLTLKDGKLEYCTGQYFPVEYRPAANRVLANLIFADYRDEKDKDGNNYYKDGEAIRKAIKRNVSRRVFRNYFA